jgi:hypothetical protein
MEVAMRRALGLVLLLAGCGSPALHPANGAPVDGISCGAERIDYHIHTHLTLVESGQQMTVPSQIGITPKCLYSLHTHDATGIIHVESAVMMKFTLGQFFDIWGQPLSESELAGHAGTVHAFIDGDLFAGNPRDIELFDHDELTLEVGTPLVDPPRSYTFPPGY